MASKFPIALFLTQAMICSIAYSQNVDSLQMSKLPDDHASNSRTQVERTEDKATATIQTGHGKIQVTCEVENVDFASQCQAEWKKTKKDKDSKEDSKGKGDSHSPGAGIRISWSSDD